MMGQTSFFSRQLGPILGAAMAIAIALSSYPALEAWALRRTTSVAEATLRLSADGLRGALDRFKPLPALIAERPILRDLLRDTDNDGLLPYVNEQLRQTAISIGASDVFLMDIAGNTIAASSYRTPLSFIGRSYAFRPYFTQALEGGIGRFFALGTVSGERGYYFAAPVLADTRIIGVIAVKFTVDPFEDAWRDSGANIIVHDLNGIIFLASRADWQFRAMTPLTPGALASIEQTRQYPLDRLVPLVLTPQSAPQDLAIVRIADGESPSDYLSVSERITAAGLTVTLLAPAAEARRQALYFMTFAAVVAMLATAIFIVIRQRRAQLRERLNLQHAVQMELEQRVFDRTSELSTANARLQTEVEERTAAEVQLRQTQAQLIQAGKLAGLGQMSAALSHEINQPLAAVKSYVDNAAAFLDRGFLQEARDNMTRISAMTDRMASISKHLRNFARRPQQATGPLIFNAVVQDAIAVSDVRIKADNASIDYTPPGHEVWVIGGHVRLQQVIVNLISNALDAMSGTPDPVVFVTIDGTTLTVRDTGPGVDPEIADQIFDPFFSTKGPGKGLGLGLSISYNIVHDFGGSLTVANHQLGGAVFTLTLLAPKPEKTTEK
jgi:two-component system C4-dicarboxylate transport sensor histidine kinase DctB